VVALSSVDLNNYNKVIRGSTDIEQLIHMYGEELTALQIAKQLNVCKSTVLKNLRASGVKMRTRLKY